MDKIFRGSYADLRVKFVEVLAKTYLKSMEGSRSMPLALGLTKLVIPEVQCKGKGFHFKILSYKVCTTATGARVIGAARSTEV